MPGPYAAYLFDMDGLLIESRDIWRAAQFKLLEAIGAEWTDNLAMMVRGRNAIDQAALLHAEFKPKQSVAWCTECMRDALIEAYAGGDVEELPGAGGLVRQLHGTAPMAVASGSPLMGIEKAMTSLGVRDCFDVLLSSEDVENGKPAPDVFLATAQQLGVDPTRCVVFEDSIVGTTAGLAAGMDVFVVPSDGQELVVDMAARTFSSLAEITLEDVGVAS